jgi:ABC-type lipoprotein export system ATPase subunit
MNQILTTTSMVLQAHGITRDFKLASGTLHVLRGIDLHIAPGELVALRGRSGSGKTTLLNILVGLDNPTSGRVEILGRDPGKLNEADRATPRSQSLGLLFQNAHLFPSLTALENVELALRLQAAPAGERRNRSLAALERVGLAARVQHRALELSGGEQQRVALARSLVHQPRLIVADEPTGNLDLQTGQNIIQLLRTVARETHTGLLIATHDAQVVSIADRTLHMNDGLLIER